MSLNAFWSRSVPPREERYPETQALIKVYGVGHLTALTFVLTLGNKERFQRSRDVGCYLGLRPRRSQSGDSDPQLGITKAGNGYDCARGWALTEADRKLATSLLLLDLNQHRAKGSYKAFLNPRNAIRKNLREW